MAKNDASSVNRKQAPRKKIPLPTFPAGDVRPRSVADAFDELAPDAMNRLESLERQSLLASDRIEKLGRPIFDFIFNSSDDTLPLDRETAQHLLRELREWQDVVKRLPRIDEIANRYDDAIKRSGIRERGGDRKDRREKKFVEIMLAAERNLATVRLWQAMIYMTSDSLGRAHYWWDKEWSREIEPKIKAAIGNDRLSDEEAYQQLIKLFGLGHITPQSIEQRFKRAGLPKVPSWTTDRLRR